MMIGMPPETPPETGSGCAAPAILPLPDGGAIAYRRLEGKSPGIVFLGGFRSDMAGTKATALEAACRQDGRAFVRFDYSGHGASSGDFLGGTIGRWRDDALAVLDSVTEGRQILIGSSMGGWIMLLVALARPDRVAGLLGVAAAPDFTEDLIWARYDTATRAELVENGACYQPSEYDGEPYPISYRLIEEGRNHLLLRRPIPIHCPIRLLHGKRDADVPWATAARIAGKVLSDDVRVVLAEDGDHRLSREEDLARLRAIARELCETAGQPG